MRFAVLGTGDVGKTLASGLHERGHDVTLGTRDPSAGHLVEWLARHPGIDLATFADAAEYAEAAILAVRWSAVPEVLEATGPHLAERLLIDVTNPLAGGDGAPRLDGCEGGGQRVQRWAPQARVVKCWNIVGHPYMIDPRGAGLPETPTMFIAGDDRVAKEDVRGLLRECGWPDVVDVGGIDASRDLEGLAMVWIRTYFATGSGAHAFRLVRG